MRCRYFYFFLVTVGMMVIFHVVCACWCACCAVRTIEDVLYARLEGRGYSADKITENLECEIMQVVADSARESYPKATIIEGFHETEADTAAMVEKVRDSATNVGNSAERG